MRGVRVAAIALSLLVGAGLPQITTPSRAEAVEPGMEFVFASGLDHGPIQGSDPGMRVTNTPTTVLEWQTGVSRTGFGAYHVVGGVVKGGADIRNFPTFPFGGLELWAGGAFRFTSFPTTTANVWLLVTVPSDGTAGADNKPVAAVNALGRLRLLNSGNPASFTESQTVLSPNKWYYLLLHGRNGVGQTQQLFIYDGDTGVLLERLDLVIDVTGSFVTMLTKWGFGTSQDATGIEYYLDDLFHSRGSVNPGPIRVFPKQPVLSVDAGFQAVGAATSAEATGEHLPDGDSTYTASLPATGPQEVSFGLQAASLSSSNPVYAVQLTSIARFAQTLQVAAQVGLRIGGIDYTNQVALQSTYSVRRSVYTTNPRDGLPWSIEDVDDFEGIVKDTSATTAEMRFTSLWGDVVYGVRALPQVSLLDPVAGESDAEATFTLTLDRASQETVTVDVATAPASASSPEDFAALQTQVSFDPGQLQATVAVQLNPDALDEDDETFTLELSGAQGLGIADPSGAATITDDDAPPGVTIDDVVVPEGDQGTSPATFTLALDAPSGRTITVAYTTQDGSATSPGDYAGLQDELSFAPGQMERTIQVPVNGDVLFEGDESFTLVLSDPTHVMLTDANGVATITNDDPEPAQSVLPSSFMVESGSTVSGNASSLAADDDDYLVVRSTKLGTKVATWFATFTGIDNGGSSLLASYKGKSSVTCTQVISIFRWTDSSWIQLDSRSIGDAEVDVADLSPSGTLADYVSGTSGAGEVRVRVSCSTPADRIDLSADVLKLTVGSALAGHTLTVFTVGTGTGTVTSSPPGISCRPECSQAYAPGRVVTLTATPEGGSTFTGWSGDCSGTGTCQVTMNAPASVTATFTSSAATVVFPSSFTVESGSTVSGNASSLAADDDDYLVVRSTKLGTKVATWFATFTGIDNGVSSLLASYKGKSSVTCTQVISVFRWTDSSWIQLDSRSIGDAEVEVADLSPSGTLADYVSGTSGAGEVWVRVTCSTPAVRIDLSADVLKLVF